MGNSRNWLKAGLLAGSALTLAACSTYPSEPRYSTRPVDTGQAYTPYGQGTTPGTQQPAGAPAPVSNPYYQPSQAPAEPEVYHGPTAGSGSIEGGGLPPADAIQEPARPAPRPVAPTPARPTTPPASTTPALVAPVSTTAGSAYVIQPGDTLSGVGRRFQTPVQSLIDMNNLDPRGSITAGQRILLPTTAADRGTDLYATGPAPTGIPAATAATAPAAPPRGNPPLTSAPTPAPAPARPAATSSAAPAAHASSSATTASLALQWPVRGDVLRRFGPVGMGERNNGINIGASAGSSVKASADGTVAYVGDDIVGQGLTVLIVHRDGWRTVYSHLGSATVRDGARVRAGQDIGTVGLSAGDGRPSIHFEVRQMRGDDPVALDPLSVLPR